MQYEFIPRILSGAAELEIDFYRDLYELGVWWALLSGHDRETRARRVLERSLYNVEGFREAFDREAAKGGEFFDVIDQGRPGLQGMVSVRVRGEQARPC